MQVTIRQATPADMEGILAIVNYYAGQDLMLYRTREQVELALPGFLVAVAEGAVIACGSLVELTPELVEVRSLAVAPDQQNHGLGRRMVSALVERARAAGYVQACALTLRESFFNGLGFETVGRWTLAPKIWQECIFCSKFHACDEIGVLMNLVQPAELPNCPAIRLPGFCDSQASVGCGPA
jgi:amino-acid N-acetyltransferase